MSIIKGTATTHVFNEIKDYMLDNAFAVMEWTSRSRYLSPIEKLWKFLSGLYMQESNNLTASTA